MHWGKLFVSAGLAGVMISAGGMVYLSCAAKGQPVAGAVLFAVGLFTVCAYGLALFTGRVGYLTVNPPSYLAELAAVWLGNAAGTLLCGLAARIALPGAAEGAAALTAAKLSQHPVQTVLLGLFCGLLMYIAVDHFRKGAGCGRYLGIVLCVPAFILAGFEHCVADMFYLSAGASTAQAGACTVFLLLATAGNAAGAVLLPLGRAANTCG